MKLPRSYTAAEIAQMIDARISGNENAVVTGINELNRVESGDICFSDHPKYFSKSLNSSASVVILNGEAQVPENKAVLIVDHPFNAFRYLCRFFRPTLLSGVAVPPSSDFGEGTHISPNCTIGENVRVGKNCILHPGVVLYQDVVIGDHVTIHANTVIGADAFYYQKREGRFQPMHTCGRVIIEDHVDIGATCTIDRGVTADTVIGAGTKIDNQVHIGHDTRIGTNCLLAGQSAVAGCVTIGNDVTIWGNVAISSKLTIGDGAEILAKSGLGKDCPAGARWWGAPAGDAREKFREIAALRKLGRGE